MNTENKIRFECEPFQIFDILEQDERDVIFIPISRYTQEKITEMLNDVYKKETDNEKHKERKNYFLKMYTDGNHSKEEFVEEILNGSDLMTQAVAMHTGVEYATDNEKNEGILETYDRLKVDKKKEYVEVETDKLMDILSEQAVKKVEEVRIAEFVNMRALVETLRYSTNRKKKIFADVDELMMCMTTEDITGLYEKFDALHTKRTDDDAKN